MDGNLHLIADRFSPAIMQFSFAIQVSNVSADILSQDTKEAPLTPLRDPLSYKHSLVVFLSLRSAFSVNVTLSNPTSTLLYRGTVSLVILFVSDFEIATKASPCPL